MHDNLYNFFVKLFLCSMDDYFLNHTTTVLLVVLYSAKRWQQCVTLRKPCAVTILFYIENKHVTKKCILFLIYVRSEIQLICAEINNYSPENNNILTPI